MKKQTQKEFIKKSKFLFKNKLDYSKVNYINSKIKVNLICKIHGDFSISPAVHLSYKRGCPLCSNKKYDTNSFIEKSIKIHKNKYLYNKVKYLSIKKHVIITCKIHGDFFQTPDKHIRGQGCSKCSPSCRKDINYFLGKAKKIHGNKYDYSEVFFTKIFTNVKIICPNHGPFNQTPANHINHKMGCARCHSESTRIGLINFIKRANIAHNYKYDYSKSIYVNCATKIEIICNKHGSFFQNPTPHIRGANCPWCVGKSSKIENEWLNYLKVPKKYRNKVLKFPNKYYRVDAFNPVNNTIYEFYGDYWHGNPNIYNLEYFNKHNKQKFEKLYLSTIEREKELISLGYKLITIWESDFKKILKTCKELQSD
jgi:G:T-mismatch repair DNA endonuclease (very short patch repair protein)